MIHMDFLSEVKTHEFIIFRLLYIFIMGICGKDVGTAY